MELRCPHCGYGRELPDTEIPAGPLRVTCPSCAGQFAFDAGERTEEPRTLEVLPPDDSAPAAAEPRDADRPRAGFWVRLAAAVIDSCLVSAVQMATVFVFALTLSLLMTGAGDSMIGIAVSWLFGCSVAIAYYTCFTAFGGQTPGKMALRIKVIRTDGAPLTLGRACYRETAGKFASGIILGIGYLMVAFDPQKQGLHDRMADTYVIRL